MSALVLTLTPRDVTRRISTVAKPGGHLRFENENPGQAESDKFNALMETCRYDDVFVMNESDPRIGLYAPPTGYVAVMHEDTTFRIEMIDHLLFRGVSVLDLNRSEPFRESELQEWLRDVNKVIRDDSPLPGPAGDWMPSLGPFGWIGLYEKRVAGTVTYSIICISGLDVQTFGQMHDRLVDGYHHQKSVLDAYREVIEPYGPLASENRARLLTIAVSLLPGETPNLAQPGEHPIPVVPQVTRTIPDELWNWVPRGRVPAGFRMPRVTPRGCEPFDPIFRSIVLAEHCTAGEIQAKIETVPRRVIPHLNVTIDGIKPFRGAGGGHPIPNQMIRYSQCTEDGVHLRRPNQVITSGGVGNASQYHMISAQSRLIPGGEEPGQFLTWEDPDLPGNRLLNTVCESGGVQGSSVSFFPLAVRVSCRDWNGYARGEGESSRLDGFMYDDWVGI